MNERDQIISFLLQANDAKNKQIADLQKQLEEKNAKPAPAQDKK